MGSNFSNGLAFGEQQARLGQQHQVELQNMQRNQALQQNQATSLGIATALRTGIHPDTGEPLTDAEKMMLSSKYNELQANTADLYNTRQSPNKMGSNLSTASGVHPPETALHSLAAKLHLASAQPANPPQTFTATAPAVSINGQTLPNAPATTVQGPPQTPQDVMQGIQDIRKQFMGMPPTDPFFIKYMHMKTMGASPEMLQQALKEYANPTAAKLNKPVWTLYKNADGTLQKYNSADPDSIPDGATALGLQTGVALKRQDFEDYKAAHPDYKGTPEQWAAEQSRQGRLGGTLNYDSKTGQVVDPATGKRYTDGDLNNPPDVVAVLNGGKSMLAANRAFLTKLAGIRATSFNYSKPMTTLDTANGNKPTTVTFGQMQASPGRYLPATEADKAINREALMQDIVGTSTLTRDAINGLGPEEDFNPGMKAKIAVAMRADDPHAAIDQLMASSALGDLTPHQQDFLIATRQLAENAMSMRTLLGAGQGSEDMRTAIRDTLPGLLSPDRSFAIRQLNAFDKTVNRLHRGVNNVPLNDIPMSGGNVPPPAAMTQFPVTLSNGTVKYFPNKLAADRFKAALAVAHAAAKGK